MLKIGEFAALCGTSVKTLRFYDSEGLLAPDYVDGFTGYRYYSSGKLKSYRQITVLKEAGFNLSEIKSLMAEGADTQAVIRRKRDALRRELEEKNRMLGKMEGLLAVCAAESPLCPVVETVSGGITLAVVRMIAGRRRNDADFRPLLEKQLEAAGLSIREPLWILNFENGYTETQADIAPGVAMEGGQHNEGGGEAVTMLNLPRTTVLSAVGPADTLADTYEALIDYASRGSYQITGAFREIHHPDGMAAEVQVPVSRLSFGPARTDPIDLPFEDDPEVVGQWTLIDIVPERACFHPNKIKSPDNGLLKRIYFLPGGQRYWMFGWTKGKLLVENGDGTFIWPYERTTIDGQTYMFVSQKSGEYIYYNGQPQILVLRQADTRAYTADEIRRTDRTDYAFENDEAVIGRWEAVAYGEHAEHAEHLTPDKTVHASLFYKYVHFKPDGLFEGQFGHRTVSSPAITWTRGRCLHHHVKTAPAYRMVTIDGAEYLWMEWKSGDYVFAEKESSYYLFKRMSGGTI